VTTKIDGMTDTTLDRRHLMSTLSFDRNLNAGGQHRTNLNLLTPEQAVATVDTVSPPYNLFSRPHMRNLQRAANIYDYRDRKHARYEYEDSAGNVFAGVEAIRINEILVRAATNIYEPEDNMWDSFNYWVVTDDGGSGSPRGNEQYLANAGVADNATSESTDPETVILPDPPFDANGGPYDDGEYVFKLRMRVRRTGTSADSNDNGFRVWINDELVTDSRLDPEPTPPPAPAAPKATPSAGDRSRWAAADASDAGMWYIEEALVTLLGDGQDNDIEFEKPRIHVGGSGAQDTVDVDWFYFTLEPDCEWIEMVNIGDETVDLSNWTLVSEYIRDEDEGPDEQYFDESYKVELHREILPVNDPTVWEPGPPHYIVFVIDKSDAAGTVLDVQSNTILFDDVWSSLASSANVYQFKSIANIYSDSIDFFGNEPFDDHRNTVPTVDARGTGDANEFIQPNLEKAIVSLYDDDGNLVDRVTYTMDQVVGFRSLQRDHPANPGDRLDRMTVAGTKYQNYRMRANWPRPIDYELFRNYNVLADGNYDDWRFPWDPGWAHPPSNGQDRWWSSPATANHRSDDYAERVADPVGDVKDGFFSNVGELSSMAFYNEFVAIVGYDETLADAHDIDLDPGTSMIRNTSRDENALLLAIHTGPAGAKGQDGWMTLLGDYDNPVNEWKKDEGIESPTETDFNNVSIDSVKALDTLQADGWQLFARINYLLTSGDETDLAAGNTIVYDRAADAEEATAVFVDTDNDYIIVQGEFGSDPADPYVPVYTWVQGRTIDNLANGGAFDATILSAAPEYREANVRTLVDYFTTAFIDLEAASATPDVLEGPGNYTLENWPESSYDPEVYTVSSSTDFTLTWDEDDGVLEGIYDLYSIVNYGEGEFEDVIEDEASIYVGLATVERDPSTQQAVLSLDIQNADAAAAQYRFLRVALSPTPLTFGRINVNTASERVLRGLPGMHYLFLTYGETASESDLAVDDEITNTDKGESATVVEVDTARNWLKLEPEPDSPSQWDASDDIENAGSFQSKIHTFHTLPMMIVTARNIYTIYSIGDIYTASNFSSDFTPQVFANVSSLITTRSDIYKIIVLGQAASDVNGNGIVEPGEVISEKKLEYIYQR